MIIGVDLGTRERKLAINRAWRDRNREAQRERERVYYAANAEAIRKRRSARRAQRRAEGTLPPEDSAARRERRLQKEYGLTHGSYAELLAEQDGHCATCPATRGNVGKGHPLLYVDHDHSTGKVRGLLCQDCNTALGRVKDSPERLRALAAYLERA